MKVLIISHAYVERDNHRKLEELSRVINLQIGVIYPRFWKTWHGEDKSQREKLSAKGGLVSSKLSGNTGSLRSNQKNQNLYWEFPLDTYFSGDGGRYFYSPLQFFSAIKKFKPDLIHIEEEPFTPVALETAIFSHFLNIKMIFFSWENIDLSLGLWRNFIERLVFRLSIAALVGNLGTKERIKRRGFAKKIRIIPQFGVDTMLFRGFQKDHPLQGRSLGRVYTVGFVGRPSEAKGLDLLFETLSRLDASVRLLVVSSSSHLPEWLSELAGKLGIKERIEFCLGVPHAELSDYFRRMDVFVLPSRTTKTWKEQFGRTLIEAMACGIPVIGSSSGAIPEVLGEDGFVFREGDAKDLSKYIEMLERGSDLWKEMSKRGLESVRRNYSFQKIAEKTAAFYFSL